MEYRKSIWVYIDLKNWTKETETLHPINFRHILEKDMVNFLQECGVETEYTGGGSGNRNMDFSLTVDNVSLATKLILLKMYAEIPLIHKTWMICYDEGAQYRMDIQGGGYHVTSQDFVRRLSEKYETAIEIHAPKEIIQGQMKDLLQKVIDDKLYEII